MKKLQLLTLLFLLAGTSWSQTLTITGTQSAKSIYPKMAGYNSNTSNINSPWSQTGRQNSWKKSESGLIRYPGGTVSSYWDHRKDRLFGIKDDISLDEKTPSEFVQKKNVINWVVTFSNGSNPISDLNKLIEATDGDTEVMFVLNLVTPGADYYAKKWDRSVNQTPLSDDWWAMMDDRYANALDMLERAEAEGIPVKFIEFGNEYFFAKGSAGTGSQGGAAIEPYSAGAFSSGGVTGITGAFPNGGENYADAVNDWAEKLGERFPGVNLCAIGSDANGDNASRRNDWNENVISKIDKNLVKSLSLHIYGGVSEGDVLSNETNLGDALHSIDTHWEFDSTRSKMPKGFDYWITEFDASSNKSEDGEDSWGLGLASLHQAGMWIDMGNLGILNFHQFGDLGSNGNITAFGRAYAMLGMASNNCNQAERIEFGDNTKIGTDSHVEAVEGWQFSQNEEGTTRYMIVNRSGTSKSIDVSGLTEALGEPLLIASKGTLSSKSDPGTTATTLGTTLTIPAYGIAYFSTPVDETIPKMAVYHEGKEVDHQSTAIFPEVDIENSSSNTQTFTLKNEGISDVILSGSPIVTLVNNEENEFSLVQTSLTTPLVAGVDQTFTVTFTAQSVGTKIAQIQIENNTNTKNPYTISLSATAKEIYSQIEVSLEDEVISSTPYALDFGTTYVGWPSTTKVFTVKNTGTSTLTFDANTKLTGDGFSSGTLPSSINAGSSASISINLKTLEIGDKTAKLVLSSDSRDNGTFEINMTGKVDESVAEAELTIDSKVYLANETFDFGTLVETTGSLTKTVLIKNTGTKAIVFGDFSLEQTNEVFTYRNDLLKSTLEPGKISSFSLIYAPTTGGDFEGVLKFEMEGEPDFTFNLKGSKEVSTVLSATQLPKTLDIWPSIWENGSSITINSLSKEIGVSVHSIRGQSMGVSNGSPQQVSQWLTELNTQLPNGIYLINVQDTTNQLIKIIKR